MAQIIPNRLVKSIVLRAAKYVAVKGWADDWAMYYSTADMPVEMILSSGAKVRRDVAKMLVHEAAQQDAQWKHFLLLTYRI